MDEPISNSQIEKLLDRYSVAIPDGLSASIRTYISMLLKWNSKISLTTVINPNEILKFHIGESLFAASAVPIKNGRLADVGSGAGFPGLPLAMLLPQLDVVLIESNLKKATFMSEVIRTLDLRNAMVWRGRMEEMSVEGADRLEFITARALGHHDNLLAWSKKALSPAGRLILWLGSDEAARISKAEGWRWLNPMPIPDSERRVILVGSPSKAPR